MSKKTENPRVIWNLSGDALRPKDAPWGFIAQNPFQRSIPPGASIEIDTGIAANVPMIASPRGDQADHVTVPTVIPAGRNLVVRVENKSQHVPLVVDDAEPVANITPLLYTGTSEVG